MDMVGRLLRLMFRVDARTSSATADGHHDARTADPVLVFLPPGIDNFSACPRRAFRCCHRISR